MTTRVSSSIAPDRGEIVSARNSPSLTAGGVGAVDVGTDAGADVDGVGTVLDGCLVGVDGVDGCVVGVDGVVEDTVVDGATVGVEYGGGGLVGV